MLDTKTRNEILLEEKIAKIDDINFDKIYDVEEFANKQLDNFDNINLNFDDESLKSQNAVNDNSFEVEVESNEFLDNLKFEEEQVVKKKEKLKVNNKLLLFTFTSIASLLCILLIYNVFFINSLNISLKSAKNLKVENAYNSSINIEEENSYILLENASKIEIDDYAFKNNFSKTEGELNKTDWFDVFVNEFGTLFGS